MKKILFLLFAVLPILGYAQQEHMTFKGVPINGKLTDMVTKLEKAGFYDSYKADECHYALRGTFTGESCDIFITATPKTKTVCSVMVSYKQEYNSWSTLKSKYIDLRDAFKAKYGEPISDNKSFKYPYTEGDGHEITAIAVGKCDYSCVFKSEDKGYVVLYIGKGGSGANILLLYSDNINSKLQDQEDKANVMNDI